jgi:hypothetical protein
MGIDIRVPMGFMFCVFGCILAFYGLLSDRVIYARSLGININLFWGMVLVVFGALMLGLGLFRTQRKPNPRVLARTTPVIAADRDGE